MKINKKIMIPLLTFTVMGAAVYSGKQAFASTDLSNYPPMMQRLAEHFGLKAEDVKTFFEEERQQRQSDNLSDYSDFLDEAVAAGELSEDQKSLLIAKKKDQQSQIANFQPGDGAKPTEADREKRREEMQVKRDEMIKWAKDNGIDQKYLFSHVRGNAFGEGRWGEGRGMKGDFDGKGFGPIDR